MSFQDYMEIALSFIGGIGLFIYGMSVMASALQKSAGSRMKRLLGLITANKFVGVLVGIAVTGIMQSSSATTVMVVGFVNAGLMTLVQSVGIIMGANIGTTVTGWLVSSVEWAEFLNPARLAPIATGVGAAIVLFSKKDKTKQIGGIIVGFGILFMGMNIMSGAVKPLRESESFAYAFTVLGSNPILGILAGAAVTAIIQSSSASVGILQSLALAGLVPWNAAVYIIMGQNIGTCVTALLSGIGASKNAKSAAYIHLLFNVFGSIAFSILAVIFFKSINPTMGIQLISITEISLVHTAFNVANTILLYPFDGVLIALAQKMTNSGNAEPDEGELIHLDDRILETPAFAIESCIEELVRMGNMTKKNLETAYEALLTGDSARADKVLKREQSINALERAITSYLVKLCNSQITDEQRNMITTFFHTVSDIERVGDHSENIAEAALDAIEEGLEFSQDAHRELDEIFGMTIRSFEDCIKALHDGSSELAMEVVKEEKAVDLLEKRLRANHIERLASQECHALSGVIFIDTISNLERISDHALNIAQTVLKMR